MHPPLVAIDTFNDVYEEVEFDLESVPQNS